jgi:hypothetical protein
MPEEDLPFEPRDLTLRYRHEQRAWSVGDAFESALDHWDVEVLAEPLDENDEPTEEISVGWASVTIFSRYSSVNGFEAFDAIDGDYYTVGAVLFDPRTGDLAKGLEAKYSGVMGDILLCERTWIDPKYRGHDVGLLVKAMSLSALGRGCGIAVTYPAPFEGEHSDAGRKQAIKALGAHWGRLGFQHFKKGVWVLDLSLITFEERRAELLGKLEVSR